LYYDRRKRISFHLENIIMHFGTYVFFFLWTNRLMYYRCKRQANHARVTASGVSTWSLPKRIGSIYLISNDNGGFLLIFNTYMFFGASRALLNVSYINKIFDSQYGKNHDFNKKCTSSGTIYILSTVVIWFCLYERVLRRKLKILTNQKDSSEKSKNWLQLIIDDLCSCSGRDLCTAMVIIGTFNRFNRRLNQARRKVPTVYSK